MGLGMCTLYLCQCVNIYQEKESANAVSLVLPLKKEVNKITRHLLEAKHLVAGGYGAIVSPTPSVFVRGHGGIKREKARFKMR